MCSYLYLLRSPCAVVSATNCKTCKTKLCKKKYDVELPPFPPKKKFIKIPDTTNSGIISGFNMNWRQKSKRNCDTKQQNEALSQPLSFCQKIWWSTCVKLKKWKEKKKISYSSLIVWQISALARVTWLYYVCAKGGGRCVQNQRKYMRPPLIARNLACA